MQKIKYSTFTFSLCRHMSWGSLESIDIWTLTPQAARAWYDYLGEILMSLARWLSQHSGITERLSTQPVVVCEETSLVCAIMLVTYFAIFQIPHVALFPNHFDLFEIDHHAIMSLLSDLSTRPCVRLRLPRFYSMCIYSRHHVFTHSSSR